MFNQLTAYTSDYGKVVVRLRLQPSASNGIYHVRETLVIVGAEGSAYATRYYVRHGNPRFGHHGDDKSFTVSFA